MVRTDQIAGLAELIRDNQPCVALTGAGVSTESVYKYRRAHA